MDADIKYLFIIYFLIGLVIVLTGLALLLFVFAHSSRKKSRQMSLILDRFKATKLELENVDKAKTNFVNSITHEIRTPMNAITVFSDMIANGADMLTEEEKAEYVGIINDNVKKLTDLVENLVTLSSLGNEKLTLNITSFTIPDLLAQAVRDAKPALGVRIYKYCNVSELTTIVNDRDKILHILNILLDNACKFTEQGNIDISCDYSERKGYLLFTVADTGPGIPVDKQDFIFKKFTKIDEFKQGNGLGLYVGRRICRIIGANLNVDTKVKLGARFLFEVPVEKKAEEQ